MGKPLMIILASSLLVFLQTLEVVNGVKCYGSLASNSSYAQNRRNLFSTLTIKVLTSGGFYNASLGQNPNKVYALGLCARGFMPKACLSCLERMTLETQRDCPTIMDSFIWGSDDEDRVSCLLRSSNHSFGNLELSPPVTGISPDHIGPSINMTLFRQQWEYTVNMTLEAATKPDTSSVHNYYSAVKAEFTAFPNVYMLAQCTPDITSQDCKQCLEVCLKYFREQFPGRTGGMVSRPSCLFRWDLFSFHGVFDNVTRVLALPRPQPQEKGSSIPDKKGRSLHWGIITIIVVFTFFNLLVFIGFYKVKAWKIELNNGINVGCAEYSDSDSQLMLRFNLDIILLATADFSSENKLGQGGFGTVYKGTLLNGKEIAVKRLTRGAGGDIEFRNEVLLLTRLQHKNLVKLLGFCNEGDEEILVYEFLSHSSLDRFIFDEEKRSLLTWEVRFKIIEGIARGLVYLHEDSQLKIIHRDLKASNILLDAEMNPKVADFGTARLFETDETQAETKRIAGTRGYMAPEYLNHGQISAKSDVYSFGIVLLEMISGHRNNSFEREGIAAFAWKRWTEGRPEVIIDPILTGLLCVQENPTNRPTMSSVMVWFGSETINIPLPKAPAFTESHPQSEDGTMSMSNAFTELSSR
ncbi:putative cysteine-rich receptor-like protein kinase 39 [Raphanus sativus]|nr:putative cysteine-rich receptor-like protein kinase 39 [Raphanus sativus]